MNIESVKERIASLEAAGELTIKERIYLYSMKEHIALAEENSLMRKLLPDYISVPATDNFLASLRAEGVENLADIIALKMKDKSLSMRHKERLNFAWAEVKAYAAELHNAQLRSQFEQVKGDK